MGDRPGLAMKREVQKARFDRFEITMMTIAVLDTLICVIYAIWSWT